MKKFLSLIFFLCSFSLAAQTTSVTATVTDSDGTAWAGGTWKISFVPNGAYQNISIYNQNAVPLSTGTLFQNGSLDNSGNLSFSIYDSSTVTPLGSSWSLTICPKASSSCGIYNFSSSGVSMNISSALTFIIPPPRFVGVAGTYGYADVEVTPSATPGSTYYSVSSQCQKYYNDLTFTWACVSASGGGFLPLTGGVLSGGLTGTSIAASTMSATNFTGLLIGHATSDLATSGGGISGPVAGSGCGAGTFFLADGSAICGTPAGNSNATFIQTFPVDTTAPVNGQTLVYNGTKYIPQSTGSVLPSATDTFNKVLVNSLGVGSIQTAANSFYDAVATWGVVNTGLSDVSALLQTKINALCALNVPAYIFLPAGTYLINNGIDISATSSTCTGVQLLGAGRDVTFLKGNCSGSNKFLIRYNNTTNSGDSWLGQRFADFTLQDTSGTGACQYGMLINQGANVSIDRVKTWSFSGATYSTGTITIAGSTVTGSGTTFTSDMVQGKIQVTQAGIPYRATICAFGSATSLTLCSSSFNTGNIAIASSYAIAYRGQGLSINGGFSYSQYISIRDYFGYGDLECMSFAGATSGGVSRISVDGKNGGCDGLRVPNSIGFSISRRGDTIKIGSRANNVSLCGFSDSAHANVWDVTDCELNSTYTVVTTCNGGVATQSCNIGWETTSDSTGDGWNNTWISSYAYLVGTVYQFDNANGAFNSSILADRTLSGQYLNHYSFSGATGCPGNGSGIKSTILNYDCNHALVTQTIN